MPGRSLLALALLVFAGCSQDQPRTNSMPQETTSRKTMIAIPEFQNKRSFDLLLKQTAFGPRNPGSAGHDACLQFLVSALRPLADNVRTQEFSLAGYDGEQLHLTNVIASFKPEASTRILLCAHWDTRPRAERDQNPARRNQPIIGANDGASGVAVLLEIATLLKSIPPPVGVDLVFFDGEDYGREGDTDNYFLGARYFAKASGPAYRPKFGILLDMVGDAELDLPREMNSVRYAPDIVTSVWSTARRLGITQFSDVNGDEILDDHIPLNEAGIKTIDIIDFAYPDASHRYWHTHEDTPEHCSAESLGAVGTVVTNVIYTTTP
jgi:glutaminyl-peptide cyclotransferase